MGRLHGSTFKLHHEARKKEKREEGNRGLLQMQKIIMTRTHPWRKFNFITKETQLFMTITFHVMKIIVLLHHCL